MLIYIQTVDAPEAQSLFERIYLDYRDRMMAVAYGLLQDRFDAEDAVHQAFVYIAENLDKFTESRSNQVKSYIMKLVECRAIDILRSRQRKTAELEETRLGQAQQYPGLSELAGCMAQLPERYRNGLILRHAYGYSFAQIGTIMNITEAAARKLTARAREKLEEICRKEGIL